LRLWEENLKLSPVSLTEILGYPIFHSYDRKQSKMLLPYAKNIICQAFCRIKITSTVPWAGRASAADKTSLSSLLEETKREIEKIINCD